MSIAKSITLSLPLRALATGIQATTALTVASVTVAADVAETLGKTAGSVTKSCFEACFEAGTAPLRDGAKAVSGELSRETLGRHCWRGGDRAWIEVRGLGDDGELGRLVLESIRAHPGVASASLNYPLSRVVVGIDEPATTLRELCRVVADAEKRYRSMQETYVRTPAPSLPGDGLVLATRAVTLAANAAGLGLAVSGRALRWPRLPSSVLAGVVAFDYQPRLRGLLEDRIGAAATDTVMTLAVAAAETLTQAPASLSVGLVMQTLKAAESRAAARAWHYHEPLLARHADQAPIEPVRRPAPTVERATGRFSLIQAISAGLVGASTRNLEMAATAALVATRRPAEPHLRHSPPRSGKGWPIGIGFCRCARRACAA
ncbi:metal cation transporting p-type ATPase CtpH domain protein [Mycobacterium kansasii]|uniref:Metal cation transporting P-type ATPase CtpH domain protein n=1 Tax=Mycobacterium kansasii TaxID=1768 RepID=A0A1V3WRH7_MYCKA|nr:metal cation transporting p-type ATPase CtpH domain protein [Mycobacterium kansasii]